MPHVFERMYRGTNTTVAGTGLGLFIARTFVDAMRGTIAAAPRNDGGRGLCVAIALPAASAAA